MDNYRIKHKILCYLYNKITYTNNDIPQLTSTKSSLKEISKGIKIPYHIVYLAHHGLPDTQAKCILDNNINEHYMVMMEEGMDAVIGEYWLKEGIKNKNEIIYTRTKWLVPFLALLATFYTLTIATCNKSGTQDLSKRIELLEKELIELKEKKNK